MNKQDIISKLKDIKPRLENVYGITSIALFGSYSRDEQTPQSDIDLLVEHKTSLGFKFLDMMYELDKLFSQEVQVVSRKGVKSKYFDAIKSDLIYV